MKKTFTINISGRVFHIDDDAHEKLSNYLIRLTRYFGNDPDAKEIVQDIEARISELFSQTLKSGSEVITLEHVDGVIQTMGMPEAISDTKAEESTKKIIYTKGKKLYRDPDSRVLGGVCSGLGAYFSLDPVVIRILFIVLVILGAGSFLLVYLILWIVVPKARNTAQRLEMKGEEVNITNISKSIKEEIQDVTENYKNFRYSRGRDGLAEAGNVLLSLFKAVLKIAVVVIGVVLVALSIITLISLILSLFVSQTVLGIFPWTNDLPNYLGLFVSSGVLTWFWIGLLLVIGIPVIMLAYLGLRIIFRFKSSHSGTGYAMFGVWLIGLIILISSVASGFSGFRNTSTSTKQEILPISSDTLYLNLGRDDFSDYVDQKIDIGDIRIASLDGKASLVGNPEFTIQRSETDNFSLITKAKAKGRNLDDAQANAREIIYNIDKKDSMLTFQPWFVIPGQSSWHLQKIQIILKVPENKTVYISEELVKIIDDIENTSNTWNGDLGGKYWTMTPNGLELAHRKAATEKPIKNTGK